MLRFSGRSAQWLRLLTLLLAFTLVAAACGGDDGDGGSAGGGSDEGPDAQAEDEGEPALGGSVTYGLEAETANGYCLPEAQLAISGIQVARSVYDTLTAPNADGEITPYLAESFEANDDFTEWTLTLREGIKFHDGTDLTAEVVKNNIDAYRGQYEGRSPLLFIFVLQNIASVEAVDDLTVRITTTEPWVALPWTLWSSARMGIVAQAQLDSDDCANQLIGTGPFKLESPGDWVVNERMDLTRNENYWQTDENGIQLPYLDSLSYVPMEEASQRISALETDVVQMVHTSGNEEIADRLQPLADADEIKLTVTDAFGEVNYIMFNVGAPPFDNKNARLAVAHGLDRELLDEVRGAGLGTIADGPFQEDVIGHLADTGFPQFDQALAEEFAAAYQEETGQPLEFTYSTTAVESNQLTAQEIQGQLAEVDIKMNIRSSADQTTLIDEAIARDFQAVGWRNHPGADPDTQYNWWYTDSPVNFGAISDPEIDRLLDEGRTNPDEAARVAAYEDLNRQFGSEVYNLWTTFTNWAIGTSPEVNGLFGPDMPGGGGPFPGLATGHLVHGLYVNTADADADAETEG